MGKKQASWVGTAQIPWTTVANALTSNSSILPYAEVCTYVAIKTHNIILNRTVSTEMRQTNDSLWTRLCFVVHCDFLQGKIYPSFRVTAPGTSTSHHFSLSILKNVPNTHCHQLARLTEGCPGYSILYPSNAFLRYPSCCLLSTSKAPTACL